MRYPSEAAVFEVFGTDGRVIPNGAHVEGIDIGLGGWNKFGEWARHKGDRAIGVRDPNHKNPHPNRHPAEDWVGAVIHTKHLRPLTRAAREMLAPVKP